MKKIIFITIFFLLGGFTFVYAMSSTKEEVKIQLSECPIFETRNWHAWTDNGGKNGSLRLVVHGEIDLPNPAYSYIWRKGPMDRRNPPAQNLILEMTPSEGMAIQVISPTKVTYSAPSAVKAYRAVNIICGDKKLAEILDVTPTD